MEFANCTAVKLTSKEGRPYWFRTCDLGQNVWEEGAHVVSFPAGGREPLFGLSEPLPFAHAVLGTTYNDRDTWLLDGVNDAGLMGGILALYESYSAPTAFPGYQGIMGMEVLTYLLATCATADEAARRARTIQALDVPVKGARVTSAMHCMLLDPSGKCVILEAADAGHPGVFTVYPENLGLMTNSPTYPQQLQNLSWFLAHSPELNWGRETPAELTLNGLTVRADPNAPHLCTSGAFPASYAACDRFIRQAVLTALNHEGRDFPDERMLALGAQLMCSVIEPRNQGVFHYLRFDKEKGPIDTKESYTQYLTMYDPTRREMFLKPYGETAWTRGRLTDCPRDRVQRYTLCREPMRGVVDMGTWGN